MKKISLTGAETFWYVVMNIAFGAAYLAKIPAKKALEDFGMVQMTGAEKFWYVLSNICFGSGYLLKVIQVKALSEIPQFAEARQALVQSHQLQQLR